MDEAHPLFCQILDSRTYVTLGYCFSGRKLIPDVYNLAYSDCIVFVPELHSRVAFIDFLKGILQFDPAERWTPGQVCTTLFCRSTGLTDVNRFASS
jgi:hypothetical protein